MPAAATQINQTGTFVYVVKDGVATVRNVTVERTVDGMTAIETGLEEGEMVVTDGQLQLINGTKVSVRTPKSES